MSAMSGKQTFRWYPDERRNYASRYLRAPSNLHNRTSVLFPRQLLPIVQQSRHSMHFALEQYPQRTASACNLQWIDQANIVERGPAAQ